MGVYIKGMKMPKDDQTIRFVKLLNGKMVAVTSPTKGVGDIHEVVSVTEPHGRLIDADDVIEHAAVNGEDGEFIRKLADYIDDAEAVIEAEGE